MIAGSGMMTAIIVFSVVCWIWTAWYINRQWVLTDIKNRRALTWGNFAGNWLMSITSGLGFPVVLPVFLLRIVARRLDRRYSALDPEKITKRLARIPDDHGV